MNAKVKLAVFWGVGITAVLLVVNFFLHLFARQPQSVVITKGFHPGGRGHHGGYGGPRVMDMHYGGFGFSWFSALLFLLIGLALVVLFIKWLNKKSKQASMQQLIETPLTSSYSPYINQNARVLDQWEKNNVNKKENL